MTTDLENSEILVVGLARSGLAAANFLIRRGAMVTITDIRDQRSLKDEVAHLVGPAKLVLGEHRQRDFLEADAIILSPGVPVALPELTAASSHGVPIWSEVELAHSYLRGPIIGVTGSNGKTTTVSLLGELLAAAGRPSAVVGNIGSPLIQAVEEHGPDPDFLYVVELSSFQLETVQDFRCDVSVLLNITPDHLDRYPGFEEYAAAKERVFRNQRERDFAVVNADDARVSEASRHTRAQVFPYSRTRRLEEGAMLVGDTLTIRRNGSEIALLRVSDLPFKGAHNLENALAAAAAAHLVGTDAVSIRAGLSRFKGVEHRLEFCGRSSGIDFYNDSKATNVESARRALESFESPLVVIMGGLDKGGDFQSLREVISRRAKRVIVIGAASDKIHMSLKGAVPISRTADLDGAFREALRFASRGDTVLLAPACASFDQFENYEQRGRVFKRIVMKELERNEVSLKPTVSGEES